MFGFLKKDLKLVSPIEGKTIDLSKVNDPVFAEKMAGDGLAIDSTGNIVVAPCDGTLTLIFKTNHAFSITTDNGVELLIHIGLDTVTLNGEGFERLAEEGQKVKAGTPIVKLNREFIESKGISLVTPVLITNVDSVKSISPIVGIDAKAGETDILTYKK
ncbi:PTS sugar transporter subunit IIA [Clostridium massiliamazoniense]|uniref:PTS sugar transporter subunit IIA n=1 Tax=Clostridium massiliamazoniense TaxID=1347366 RepID=UPI0006D7A890|nr:PTS glucose transporter subunit IIA [Clostridium massiliamazoniense]